MRIKLRALVADQFGPRLIERERLTVGPKRGHRVECVGHGDHPRFLGNLGTSQTIGITLAVPAFVMTADDAGDILKEAHRGKNLTAQLAVAADLRKFFLA